ncbi:MAG: hypothetical protein AAB607_00240 [Patescibacteria group bacterium]
MNKLKILFFSVIIGLTAAVIAVNAWTSPTANPPGGGSAISAGSNAPANSIYIKSDGNVGIGTTAPSQKLSVSGDGLFTSTLNLGSIGIIGGATGKLEFGGINGSVDGFSIGNNLGGNRLTFQAGSNPAAFFVMTNVGNVGIGTTAPIAPLQISSGPDTPQLTLTNTGAGGRTWFVYSQQGGDGNFHIWEQGAPTTRFFINGSTGNVGIGTTGPSQKLSVAGTIESTTGGIKFPDGTTQTTAATVAGSCSWVRAGPGTTNATCPGGQVAVSGGCKADGFADRGLVDSRPNPENCTGNTCTGWYCMQSQGASTVSVRCCPL